MTMIKLPILACAEKLETASKNHKLKQISTVKTENGPISQISQSVVSMVKDLWLKGFTKEIKLSLQCNSEGVVDE